MTEAWKSTPRFFCEVCRVWLNDNPSARATHERGAGHQENVAKKLRDMRKKADADKKQEAMAVATMSSIEAKARQQYAKDVQESAKAREDLTGTWEPDESSGHLYNARHRYYYDSTKRMYYGGDPPAWTVTPDIPPEALYRPRAAKKSDAAPLSGKPAANTLRPGMRYSQHPMANLGGYQMPTVGAIGGAKGVGAAKQPAAAAAVPKRKREGEAGGSKKGGKPPTKEELEAQARREAARARVQARTMQAFGLR